MNKLHKQARPIWEKHFRHMMPYDNYFEQIIRYNIYPYMLFKGVDKKVFLNHKNKLIDLTMSEIRKNSKR